jgi:hypothetical protein
MIRTVTVHRPGKSQIDLDDSQELTGEDILPDFRCRIADFFRLPGEKFKQTDTSA